MNNQKGYGGDTGAKHAPIMNHHDHAPLKVMQLTPSWPAQFTSL